MSAPPWSVLLYLFSIAVALRIAVFLTASHLYHIPLTQYASKGDGASYIAYARAICGDHGVMTEYDRRVFPGYPALIAIIHLAGVPFPIAALLIDWVSAGVAAVLATLLFRDRRIGYAMLFLVPHYLANSSLAMSEAPLLAFTLGGLVLATHNRPDIAGILFGFAGLIRPMACFALLAALTPFALERNWRQLFRTAIPAAIVVLAAVLLMHFRTGDAFRGVRIYRDSPQAYVGQIFAWPFWSLLTTPTREHVPLGTVIYIYVHVAVVLIACVSLVWRILRGTPMPLAACLPVSPFTRGALAGKPPVAPGSLDALALVWLLGNTLFILCIGSGWGFRQFPRFAIPSQPALFWALRAYLPAQRLPWLLGGIGVFVLAVVSVNQSP